ncbi:MULTISPECIES: hypothetical protein [unclassified Streptomyces]|uniref:hypothetical protein n=1 Tax=unclassified Streptomyces TaxID=2593676 RepID=UPI0018FF0619|nr:MULTISPECIES: hypothetical protein [unclassified Streptomyces]
MVDDPGGAWDRGPERGQRRAVMHLAAAAGMGAAEVGGEVLMEALAALMPGVDWAPVAESTQQAEREGTLGSWLVAGTLVDPLARLRAAGEEEMTAARSVARILNLVGFLYVMHGLLMPDNPFLARLRARIDESGFALVVSQLVPQMASPSGVPHALAMCLSPEIAVVAALLEELIDEQAGAGQGLLSLPGAEEGGAGAFKQTWIDRLHELRTAASTASARAAAPARPSLRSPSPDDLVPNAPSTPCWPRGCRARIVPRAPARVVSGRRIECGRHRRPAPWGQPSSSSSRFQNPYRIGWLRGQAVAAVRSGTSATGASGEEWEIQATTASVSCWT